MKNTKLYTAVSASILLVILAITSCQKDVAPAPKPVVPAATTFAFAEEFDNVGEIAGRGWVITNRSNPQGANAWGQGRYENNLGGNKAGKVIGMPAYSASTSPYDFISVDATAVNDAGTVNCWLVSPQTTVKNGDKLTFYTCAMSDSDWNNFAKDRLQVRINDNDASANVGTVDTANVGGFNKILLDINPTLANNDPNGYPQVWRLYTITINNMPVAKKARFGFRYFNPSGGLSGANASSLIGIDKLEFKPL